MANIRQAVIEHCRADSTLVSLVGQAMRIREDIAPDSILPALAVLDTSTRARIAAVGSDCTVAFLIKAQSDSVSSIESIRQRLRDLFHEKHGVTFGVNNPVYVTSSEHEDSGEGVFKNESGDAWYCREQYQMIAVL